MVYKRHAGDIFWLVTRSTPSNESPTSYWRLPKGWLDDAQEENTPGPLASGKRKASEVELQNAALREVAEEGGVKARIVTKLGSEKLFLHITGYRVLKFVTYYLMEWLSDLSEGPGFETAETSWLPFEAARKILTYPSEKKVLDKAKAFFDSGC
ncbi:hypothetical protein A3E41_00585 [Candidatus Woesebacteria bacterium RIFCSPHIGHO2_12_FULL_38_9]|uniref:Nudix hydrolase domain-containing protein n=1 Tax=Candidatus Woesebacteria bacterium RIFCSPHIGHO2_01_FULL_40_22 TaxID=1802499 RepID=A0A1F7YGX7_9BACT|nr:MAG: hypothetical protein A2141_03480 [Candidatus Woesebacteria bacterium RBG_16_40_11]OGM26420.1 MAG: hypothetical protein A2628_00135 [Candidatus Woesebacteria bacterium RIFCSPHIGHO2_01_FULL_40_22]OGM36492.1 MAG: hypothetical protein A3E41_00585 [Candidatus Woesebacteria bacterium RIFCSPHIGHO2_12_FULL_38_9]